MRTQQQHICKRLKEAETQFLDNDGWLHRVENDIKLLKSNDQISEVSRTCVPFYYRLLFIIVFYEKENGFFLYLLYVECMPNSFVTDEFI